MNNTTAAMKNIGENQQLIKQDILEEAITALQRTTGLQVLKKDYPFQDGEQPDALVQITRAGKTWHFAAGVETTMRLTTPIHLPEEIARRPHPRILITRYVDPNTAQRLRAAGIPFIDGAGNAYIEEPELFVFIVGNRRKKPLEHPPLTLNTAALKTVFHFLCFEADINNNYRTLAHRTDTALGTLTNHFKALRANNYLVGQEGQWHLINRGRLLREWVDAYPRRLRPKLLLGRYRARTPDWWKNQELGQFDACWGGEVAAARATHYLRPETVTIYAHANPARIIALHGLVKDPRGPIEILHAFWHRAEGMPLLELNVVHPILIYADLIGLRDERADEAAKIIFAEQLAHYAQ